MKSRIHRAGPFVAAMLAGATALDAQTVRALTGESGSYELRPSGAGRFDVRVLRIGFRPGKDRPDIVDIECPRWLDRALARRTPAAAHAPRHEATGAALPQQWRRARRV